MVVATGEKSRQFGGMIRLNESGSFLWERLTEETNRGLLIAALLEEYDVERSVAETDVHRVVELLKEQHCLV